MVGAALDAAKLLSEKGCEVRVVDMHTVKPLDEEALRSAAVETGAIIVAEEHLHHGGLGSVVAQAVGQVHPVPLEYVNVGDVFAESGDPEGLLEKYGLTADNIVGAVERAIDRK